MNIEYLLKPDRRTRSFIPDKPLPFGQLRSDHLFQMQYSEGRWHSPRIVPYAPLERIMPGAVALNYGQEIFEGLKAFRHEDGELYLFRPKRHALRFNTSADIVCMPRVPIELQVEAMQALVDVDRYWFPEQEGASLYLRPVMLGMDDSLGVKESSSYLYYMILSPGGPYYPQGFDAIPLLITDKFHRAAPGGTGQAKTGGNYAASLRAKRYASKFGAQQVLYLDVSNTYLEEAGAMNHYHVKKDGTVVIPTFTDTILKSITSQSMLKLSKRLRREVVQESVSLERFIDGVLSGEITEAGGLGTAAVVSPVGKYSLDLNANPRNLETLVVGNGAIGEVSRQMYQLLTGIQRGTVAGPKEWLVQVPRMK